MKLKFIPVLAVTSLLFSCDVDQQEEKTAKADSVEAKKVITAEVEVPAASDYEQLKEKIIKEYPNAKPGSWGEFVKGVDEDLITNSKIMALTFDACGGPHGSEYDKELIDYLKKEKLPATVFLTGIWMDANPEALKELMDDPLIEIENHGLKHRPCSVDGESEYGIKGTANVAGAVDEIELNERKIMSSVGRRPEFYRSSTAFTDELCATIANQLGVQIVSYDILSGDAVPYTPKNVIKENIISNAKSGALIIMHMNHPKWYTYEALQETIPELRKMGYSFVKLEYYKLKAKSKKAS